MISLISVGLLVFYIYSAFYIQMLNHRSYRNNIFFLININFAVSAFANFMLINTVVYHEAMFWLRVYRYCILPIPLFLLLGRLLLAFPRLNAKKWVLTGLLVGIICVLVMIESTSIGENSYHLYREANQFHWQVRVDTISNLVYNLVYFLLFILSSLFSFFWLYQSLKKYIRRYHRLVTSILFTIIIVFVALIAEYLLIMKDGLYNGIFYFVVVGMPISFIYFFVFQERKLPLAMLHSYSTDIVDNLKEGALLLDERYQIILYNSFAQKIFGWGRGESHHFSGYQRGCIEQVEKVKSKPDRNIIGQEGVLVVAGGLEIPISFSVAKIKDYDEGNKYLFLFIDTRKRKEMEDKLTRANRKLEDQILWRTNAIYEKNTSLRREMEENKKKRRQIERFLEEDDATGLLNKNGFMNQVGRESGKAELALISINILNMKVILESFSPLVADKLIIEIADFLKNHWGPMSVIARFETYRFLLYCSKQKAQSLACKTLNYFRVPLEVEGLMIEVECGIGLVYGSINKKEINRMIIESDLAANQARKYGKNQYYLYHEDMHTKRSLEFSMLNDYLYMALTDKQLKIDYNFKFDDHGKIVGLLAEMYWMISEHRRISEAEIIEIAEMYNFSQELECWRLGQITADLKYLSTAQGGVVLPVTIGLMKTTFYHEANLKKIMKIIEDSQINKENFDFSLDEDIFIHPISFINTCLSMVHNHHIRVGLKNFGGLHSSLKYLRDLEIDFIILDPDFVAGIGLNQRDEAILEMILDLAENMNYNILVETISRQNQVDFLRGRCHQYAGSYFFQSRSIAKIHEFLGHHDGWLAKKTGKREILSV